MIPKKLHYCWFSGEPFQGEVPVVWEAQHVGQQADSLQAQAFVVDVPV